VADRLRGYLRITDTNNSQEYYCSAFATDDLDDMTAMRFGLLALGSAAHAA
jgi:hypothetical protein